MINQDQLKPFDEYKEDEIKILINKGISGKLSIFTMNNNNSFHKLSSTELQQIKDAHPNPAQIYFEPFRVSASGIERFASHRAVKFSSLWSNKTEAEKVLEPLSPSVSHFNSTEPAPPYLDENHPNFAPELKIVIDAWTALFSDRNKQQTIGVQESVKKWAKASCLDLKPAALKRISTVITSSERKKKGGALPT